MLEMLSGDWSLGGGTLSPKLPWFCREEMGVMSEIELSRESRSFVDDEALSLIKSSRTMDSSRSDEVNEVPEPNIKPFLDIGCVRAKRAAACSMASMMVSRCFWRPTR
jgi:hypothetical protein